MNNKQINQTDETKSLNAREAEAVHPQEENTSPFKVYDTQADWQGEIDRIIGKRLKEKRENESAQEKYRRLSKLVTYYFGTDDVPSLQIVFANMKRAALAESLVKQVEDKRLTSGMEERKAKLYEAMRSYAEKTGKDLRSLADNPQFLRYLWDNGIAPEDADLLANKEQARQAALQEAKESIAASLLTKKGRIAENGAEGMQSAKQKKANPKNLTNADIDDILRRVQAGEKIVF